MKMEFIYRQDSNMKRLLLSPISLDFSVLVLHLPGIASSVFSLII